MKILKNHPFWSVLVGLCLVCFLALPSMAQQGTQSEGMNAQPQISDMELKKASAAFTEIVSINKDFQDSVQQTQDQNEIAKMQTAANEKMIQAVKNNGLEIEKYNTIMQQVGSDKNLNLRFQKYIENSKQ